MGISLTNDKQLTISVGNSRKATNWQPLTLTVSELYSRLEVPVRSTETLAEYMSMSKTEQDNRKDIGGFVGGRLKGPRRKADNVVDRCLLALDIDHLPADAFVQLFPKLDALGCGYCLNSTRKHCLQAPRGRLWIVTDRVMSVEEHGCVSRWIADRIGMSWMDSTTFEASRLMYWPSCCADGEYIFRYADKPFLSVETVLKGCSILWGDWRDISHWPKHPNELHAATPGTKQQDPREKNGAIGAFCRLYPFERVLDELLPGIYEPTAEENRYSYAQGTTTGGAIVFDDGLFLQSYHSTDPANGYHNMFDLVRLHKFGTQDAAALPDTPGSQLPSYKAALDYIKALPDVQEALSQEIAAEAKAAFSPFVLDGEPDTAACDKLATFEGQSINLEIVRSVMTACKYSIRCNQITGLSEVSGLPRQFSTGNSLNTLPIVLKDALKAVKIKGANDQAISGYLGVIADEGRFNPVCDMLRGQSWDGEDRLNTTYQILGLTDPFDKTLVRKWMIQCVALAFNDEYSPIGAEGVLTLQGEQGIGKTELFRRLAVDPAWFAEGVSLDMGNKDSILKSISCWICELGELDSTTRREQSALKGHLTAATDNIRAPYARAATRTPRRTSFCATVNPDAFLTDPTGNRRYWVIPIRVLDLDKLLSLDRGWFQKLWAQVYTLWENDHDGFRLSKSERDTLVSRNKQYETYLPGEEEIRQLLQAGFESIPVEQWTPWSAAAIRQRLAWTGSCGNLTSQQIGRALSRIRQDYPEIRQIPGHNHLVQYMLPLPTTENRN